MAQIVDDPGGGGIGAGSSICWLSPADMAGQIDNLMDRVANLETALALLASGDVNAALLTDLANSLGMPVDFLLNAGTGDPGDTGYSGVVFSDIGISFNGGASYIPNSAGMALIYQNYLTMHMNNQGQSGGIATSSGLAIKQVYAAPWADMISAGGNLWIHPTLTSTTGVQIDDTLLQDTTVAPGKAVWKPTATSDYYVSCFCEIVSGTAIPTTGWVNVILYKRRAVVNVFYATGTITVPPGGTWNNSSYNIGCVISNAIKCRIDPVEGFAFRVENFTDGDIRVNLLEVTFMKL